MPGSRPSLVLMGVSAAGKTVVGRQAAAAVGIPFLDADDLHPRANVEKMARGIPLDDADRAPWLDAVGGELRAAAPCIMACSALTWRYRARLRELAPGTLFALLDVPRAVLEQRLATRRGHFMPASLLDSQLAALEPAGQGERIVRLDGVQSIASLAAQVAALVAEAPEAPDAPGVPVG
ncbi:gluconokinase, GntK/IdnK-type [Microcella daejeonensis]|uniref:gluconokinase n=1 Tax=Microcella daejeonensis TaxID=2994971 RepID=UPI002270FF46|nr:gluconokinase, GntK/IdnK-type [Microcella daejeonensis]WAB85144.1 gluconokinase, GntK/IdnK-type [Microcella daejeonensis]